MSSSAGRLWRIASSYCPLVIACESQHPLEHRVAARRGGLRVLHRVVHRGRGDHPGEQRGLVGRHVDRLARVRVLLLLHHRRRVAHAGVVGAGPLVRLVTVAEVGAHGGLDPVGAVTEIDGVEVLGEDLVLGPLALEVVGERGLAQLLEDRPVALRVEGVLHELLGDRGTTLGGAPLEHVLHQGAADACVVHALVRVEAPVLDGDHGVLDVRRDLALGHQDAVLVAGELRDLLAGGVLLEVLAPRSVRVQDRVLSLVVLRPVLEGWGGRSRPPSASRKPWRSARGSRGRRPRAPHAASSAWACAGEGPPAAVRARRWSAR